MLHTAEVRNIPGLNAQMIRSASHTAAFQCMLLQHQLRNTTNQNPTAHLKVML
jgi:hypothetical protein